MGANFFFAEAGTLQLENGAFQLAVALTLEQLVGKLPVGGDGQGGGDLFPRPLVLLVVQASHEVVLDQVAEFGLRLETTDGFEEFGGKHGHFELLDLQNLG